MVSALYRIFHVCIYVVYVAYTQILYFHVDVVLLFTLIT